MKTLSLFFATTFAALLAVALTAPGCAKPCNELSQQCGLCGDADYAAACRATVNEGNEDVCQAQLGTYLQFCTDQAAGGAGGTPSTGCNGTVCAGECVDTTSDPRFCGDCVTSCGDATPFCQSGTCVDACSVPFQECGSQSCVDVSTDPNHCGDCDNACPSDAPLCSDGSCVASCDPGSGTPTQCGGSCTDLSNDPLNCGACGNVCDASEVCAAGDCSSSCASGQTLCCGKCAFTVSDPDHCGGCDPSCPEVAMGETPGSVCLDAEVCLQGSCGADCGSLSECGGACVDTNSNTLHCGGCNVLCPQGTNCVGGACTNSGCPDGETSCNGGCTDLQSDPNHCGACGNACTGGDVCSTGVCAASCTSPDGTGNYLDCNGACVNTDVDADNCGGCGNACSGGQVCALGACVDNCPPGLTPCNGGCVDLDSNFHNCGSCGNTCNDSSVCTADACATGSCDNQSGALVCNDGNQCTSDMCDPVTGCFSQDLTNAQIQQLCIALLNDPNISLSTHCIHCDPAGAACTASVIDDGIPCTDDACPMLPGDSAVYDPALINVDNDANCTTSCAATCDHTAFGTPAADSQGCVLNNSICTGMGRPCVTGCNPDAANADTVTGCVENHAVCTATCANECTSDPGQTLLDLNGCLRLNNVCAGLETCYDNCDPDDQTNANPITGCIENDNNCNAGEQCSPTSPNADATTGCCLANNTACTQDSECCSNNCAGTCQP